MKYLLTTIFMLMPFLAEAQYVSKVWNPDNGDGTYSNPILFADYSDPDVCVVGDDYYLTASSFNCIPGLPILHSKDLVNWEIIGHALHQQLPISHYEKVQHGKGVWAPSIRVHNGIFYIYWGDPDYGVMMTKSSNPSYGWSKPQCVIKGKGIIDTCPLWDEDGRCYLVNAYAASRKHINSILMVRELSLDGTTAIGNPTIVFDGNSNGDFTSEGPKFYKKDGYYYIMWPAGGVENGWQMCGRSKKPYGPYEYRRVMDQGGSSINGPHQGGWVHTSMGEDWFVHFQDKGCYGRVVHLQPMKWHDGWPVIGSDADGDGVGEPVMKHCKPKTNGIICEINNPIESDEFNTTQMGLQWQWQANYREEYGMPTSLGIFRIYTHKMKKSDKNMMCVPNMLLQKVTSETFQTTTKICLAAKASGQCGGLVMMGRDYSALAVKRVGEKFELQHIICKDADKDSLETIKTLAIFHPSSQDKTDYKPALYMTIYLRLNVEKGGKIRFAYSLDGKKFKSCSNTFQMREGVWIGAKMGLFAVEPPTDANGKITDCGYLDADWFRIDR